MFGKAKELLQSLNAPYGVYACLGNHDAGETFNQMQNFLKQSNVNLLNDSYTVIDNRLILVGRIDAHSIGGYGDLKRKPFAETGLKNDENLPVILMDHNPQNIGEYNSDVFIFGDSSIRKLLADIQVEEQNHAEMLWKYKTTNGMA